MCSMARAGRSVFLHPILRDGVPDRQGAISVVVQISFHRSLIGERLVGSGGDWMGWGQEECPRLSR